MCSEKMSQRNIVKPSIFPEYIVSMKISRFTNLMSEINSIGQNLSI